MRDRISFNDRYEVIALSEYELNNFQQVLQDFVQKVDIESNQHKRSKSAFSNKSFDTNKINELMMQINFLKEQLDVAIYKIKVLR